jgi:hypothetical protein
MKSLVLVVALLISGCATTEISQTTIADIETEKFKSFLNKDAKNTNVFKQNYLVDRYTKSYIKAKYHKAFALSESGAWAWKSDFINLSLAIEGALGHCELNNKEKQAEQPCKIVNVDGHWAADLCKEIVCD